MPPARSAPAPTPARIQPALVVIAAGVCAALHVGKLAPAVTTLQAELGLTLVQAGFLLSLVQGAGMLLGLVFGALADGLGARRSMVLGLAVLALASGAGGSVWGAPALALLMACRVAEGFGFLLVVLPAPGLVRALVPPARVSAMLGVWGAYMPLATALALLLGPLCMAAFGWRVWWWALAVLSLLALLALRRAVPGRHSPGFGPAAAPQALPWRLRLRLTLAAPGPWWVALCFAMYSAQWLAVIGFLPAIYTQAGVAAAATGVLTALVAASNIVGNLAAGRLLQRGVQPGTLLATGFVAMGVATLLAFADFADLGDLAPLPPWARYAALLGFSGFGGLIPATLFALAMRVAPGPQTVSTTVGWVQQWSALGQFAGPPLVAALASQAGGWQFTWVATGAFALAGLLFSALLVRGIQGRGPGGR